MADRPYFQQAKMNPTKDGFLAAVLANRTQGRTALYIVHRITGPGGVFLGLVMGSIRIPYFEALFKSVLGGGHDNIMLSLGDGTLVMRYPPALGAVGMVFGPLSTGQSTAGIARVPGLYGLPPQYLAVQTMTAYGATIGIAIDAARVIAPWRKEALLLGRRGGVAGPGDRRRHHGGAAAIATGNAGPPRQHGWKPKIARGATAKGLPWKSRQPPSVRRCWAAWRRRSSSRWGRCRAPWPASPGGSKPTPWR